MRSRLIALVLPALLLAMLPGAVSAAGPGSAAAARAEHARILAYWTPERMRAAQPREFQFDAVRGVHPMQRPGGGGGGGGGVTGASWPASASDPITRATGRVYFEMGGSGWICSGSVATDARTGYSIVLTAGHCAVDADTGEWATNWMFIPAFDVHPTYTCSQTTYGCWTAAALVARSEFATAGGFNDTAVTHDWAFAVVGAGGKGGSVPPQLDAAVGGSFALGASSVSTGTVLTALGYPAAGKYHGKDLTYCQGPVGRDPGTSNLTYSMACDMTGGSSGGPWLQDVSSGYGATLRSLNSYGYSGVRNMYGPVFNTETGDTYAIAKTTTEGDVLVGP